MKWQQWILIVLFAIAGVHNLFTAMGVAPRPESESVDGDTRKAVRTLALLTVQGLLIWMVATL